jgi:hypothetical protein
MAAAGYAEPITSVADLDRAVEILIHPPDDPEEAEEALGQATIAVEAWEAGAFWDPVVAEALRDPGAWPDGTIFCLITIARRLKRPEPEDLGELFDILLELFDHN